MLEAHMFEPKNMKVSLKTLIQSTQNLEMIHSGITFIPYMVFKILAVENLT